MDDLLPVPTELLQSSSSSNNSGRPMNQMDILGNSTGFLFYFLCYFLKFVQVE
jgi:hypothetical protein